MPDFCGVNWDFRGIRRRMWRKKREDARRKLIEEKKAAGWVCSECKSVPTRIHVLADGRVLCPSCRRKRHTLLSWMKRTAKHGGKNRLGGRHSHPADYQAQKNEVKKNV